MRLPDSNNLKKHLKIVQKVLGIPRTMFPTQGILQGIHKMFENTSITLKKIIVRIQERAHGRKQKAGFFRGGGDGQIFGVSKGAKTPKSTCKHLKANKNPKKTNKTHFSKPGGGQVSPLSLNPLGVLF